jgi:hypothetical protein
MPSMCLGIFMVRSFPMRYLETRQPLKFTDRSDRAGELNSHQFFLLGDLCVCG